MKLIACILLSFYMVHRIDAFRNDCIRTGEECLHKEQCRQQIQDMIANFEKLSNEQKQYIFSSRCGKAQLQKLCCQPPPPPPPRPECFTWDGRPGTCVKVDPKTAGATSGMTLRQMMISRCKKRKGPFLCISELPVTQSDACEVSAFPSDPKDGCCGRERVTPSKITGGEGTRIDEFPWLVVLKYEKDLKNCSGALISHRYVLTAAHCVDFSSPKPYAVILGEYDKRTQRDCDFENECHEPEDELTIGVEEIIPHEKFNPTDKNGRYDIALIRMTKTVTYSDFILPICLPTGTEDLTKKPPHDFKLWSAGWGDVNATYHSPSDIKRKVELPYVSPTECLEKVTRLWSDQICAGGEFDKDSCSGDSGSGLMYDNAGVFEVLGITSHGITKCGTPGTPALYTKVFSFLHWIHTHIRP